MVLKTIQKKNSKTKNISPAGTRTRITRVTGGYTSHLYYRGFILLMQKEKKYASTNTNNFIFLSIKKHNFPQKKQKKPLNFDSLSFCLTSTSSVFFCVQNFLKIKIKNSNDFLSFKDSLQITFIFGFLFCIVNNN